MILLNETSFSSQLVRTVLDAERMAASVVVRVTYSWQGSVLQVADEQPWRVSPTPWESPQGAMEADGPFMRGGVDIFLFAAARAPGRNPVSKMDVAIETPRFSRRARVTGDRVWVRGSDATLAPSPPVPFESMPLTPAQAYGGATDWDGLAVKFMGNPAGRGFVVEEERAEGTPLPNLEEPEALVQRWNDVPPVCGFGFCPMASSGRLESGTVLSEDKTELLDITPRLFNCAYPPMVAPELRPGDVLRIHGVSHEGTLEAVVPACPVKVRLRFGDRVIDRTLYVDQLGLEVEEGRLFVTYRFPFRYTVRPREVREATLLRSA